MPKKKKAGRSHSKGIDGRAAADTGTAWPVIGAVTLLLVAFFYLLGGLGSGGALPKGLFHYTYLIVGWGAWAAPVALAYFGLIKLKSEDRRVPLGRSAGMYALIILLTVWLELAFGRGGALGRGLASMVLKALDRTPATASFFGLTLVALFLVFGISPAFLRKIPSLFKGRDDDTDLGALKTAPSPGFELKEGVPVEHAEVAMPPARAIKSPPRELAQEDQQALTVASDPDWRYPGLELLNQKQDKANAGNVEAKAEIIKNTFANFNIDVAMEGANVGPRITQYTLRPPNGVKLTKITALDNNLALDLPAQSIRIEAPIPGKRAVGVEVPNEKAATVRLASVMDSAAWQAATSRLTIAIGKDIAGEPVIGVLDRMPHLLVAGQTNSGKSVMINSLLISLLYRNSPADLKLILVDPKHVELLPYNEIPHLLTPVITEPEKCISALKWAVAEMDRRYRTMAAVGQRHITEYNQRPDTENMPYIVIVIDELSDLMMMAARDVESLIVRIAQKARAVGIHLVIATQRPSVNVITGLIKANVPARIAFATVSQVDSRTIIDGVGAEKLLGNGDMLYKTAESGRPIRVQGALTETDEIHKITAFLKAQRTPKYDPDVVSQPVQISGRGGLITDYGPGEGDDEMWQDAVRVVVESGKASTSLLQRRLRLGYGRAARLIEAMEEQGIISRAEGNRPREVLVSDADSVLNSAANEGPPADDSTTGEV